MSIASKQAKERQNRTPDELVMTKTKFQPRQFQGYPDIRGYVRLIRVRQLWFCFRVHGLGGRPGEVPADPGGL